MRLQKMLPLILLVCAAVRPVFAGPFEDASAAFRKGDYETAIRLFRSLAAHGDAPAQHILGVMYDKGRGVPQDAAAAVMWLRKAAEQGFAEAQNDLGFMYDQGRGVPQDYAAAAVWYRKAADQGNASAQNDLGFMYGEGRGVPQDYVQAHMWFDIAAANLAIKQERDTAVRNRDKVAAKMTPAQIAEAQKLAQEWKPKQ